MRKSVLLYLYFIFLIFISGCYDGYYYNESTENQITASPLLNCSKPKESKIFRIGAELSTKTSRNYDYYYDNFKPQLNGITKLFIAKSIKFFSINAGFFSESYEFSFGLHIPTKELMLSMRINGTLKNSELLPSFSLVCNRENKDFTVFSAIRYGTFPQYIRYFTYDSLYNSYEHILDYRVNGFVFAVGFDYPFFESVGCKSDFEFLSFPEVKCLRRTYQWYEYNYDDYVVINSNLNTVRIGISIYIDM